MFKTRMMLSLAAFSLASGMFMGVAHAQDGEGRQRDRGDRQPRQREGGEGDRESRMNEMRQRMSERMKTALGASDEEWSVLQPRIEKVTTLQREGRMGGMMGMMGGRGRGPGRGGPGGEGGERGPGGPEAGPQSEIAKASGELRTTLADESASADSIKSKLEAYRAARKKNQEELSKAQTELRELLDSRQEAQLVMMGLLD